MQFTSLRLAGFKSFVDGTDVRIEPGLTGVVGPNGCGKSNLVEALRWVMGETSAKQVRGGDMDDVIFSGTQARPARNIAEVLLTIDNATRTAPPAFNDVDELQISRRIERESGSTYRVNGQEVRARDVQLLFADLATGAHSPALVSQGRVGALISARPTDRRALLEEAAGITGLHSRRHEAELRLRGATNNLERLDDVMQALESQLQAMKRQARQANRYRKLGGLIRRFEAIQLHLRYLDANSLGERLAEELREATRLVGEFEAQAARATTGREEIAATLPELRNAEAEAGARLHRLGTARDGLDAEEARVREEARQLVARLDQVATDIEREGNIREGAQTAMARLQGEAGEIAEAREGEGAALRESGEKIAALAQGVSTEEGELDRLTDETAAEAARRDALSARRQEADRRLERQIQRHREAEAEMATLDATLAEDDGVRHPSDRLAAAETRAGETGAALEAAERNGDEADTTLGAARESLGAAEKSLAELTGEESALARLLEGKDGGLWAPLVDAVEVQPGYETALGAALGDDLEAPTDEGAPVHWRLLDGGGTPPRLPEGAAALDRFVAGPPAVARRLAQVGLVEAVDGGRLSRELTQGQRLVSRDGKLWRWDGFTITDGAETAAAQRLAQRNRLAELRERRRAAEREFAVAGEAHEAARAAASAAREAFEAARVADRAQIKTREEARGALEVAERRVAATKSRRLALEETLATLRLDIDESETVRDEARDALAGLAPLDQARERLGQLRAVVSEHRSKLAEARNAEALLGRETQARIDRLRAIETEESGWRNRVEDAGRQQEILTRRREYTAAALEVARRKPEEIDTKRAALLEQLTGAEAARDEAADAVAGREAELADAEAGLRRAESAASEARETRARLEANLEGAADRREEIRRRIRETLDCEPKAALAAGEVAPEEELPALEETAGRLERLLRERERMGPVNLCAEQEAAELTEQLETMTSERADLEAAIQRLRQGISSLNREGRERLLAAFEQVDKHFQDLFVRLFGGGMAHLALTESEDPLEAGLEIMASPPGKRLQRLSLLSGGEQALTATALLFAVFLTNPAPICVLDEVDAPLDEANVERFCTLVQEIARVTGTRFLIITHHALTMARVDRLYGVTMAERGVSQLVSVDLVRAERLRATA